MIASMRQKIPRGAPFLAFNLLFVLVHRDLPCGAGAGPFCQPQ